MGNWMLFSFGRVSLLFVAGLDAFEALQLLLSLALLRTYFRFVFSSSIH